MSLLSRARAHGGGLLVGVRGGPVLSICSFDCQPLVGLFPAPVEVVGVFVTTTTSGEAHTAATAASHSRGLPVVWLLSEAQDTAFELAKDGSSGYAQAAGAPAFAAWSPGPVVLLPVALGAAGALPEGPVVRIDGVMVGPEDRPGKVLKKDEGRAVIPAELMVAVSTSDPAVAPVLRVGHGAQAGEQQQQQQQQQSSPPALQLCGAAPVTAASTFSTVREALLASLAAQVELAHSLLGRGTAALVGHFRLPGVPHAVTVPLPSALAEDDPKAVEHRRRLHALFLLAEDQPVFRRARATGFEARPRSVPRGVNAHLLNVHEGLPAPAGGGKVSLVSGDYAYYHYLQDGFDDAGWGCMYRTLMSAASWFQLQGYTAKPPPTHRMIQEALVAMKDKEPSFIGSKQWIGTMEASYILDRLYDITSKVVMANSGAEVTDHARVLARHFETQGTPILIGGGVLAWGLVGISYNEDTGEAWFLILDPHLAQSTGDSVQDIQKNPLGCNWRPASIFKKDAFYNFLCPQRPKAAGI
jgi:hypothetical protein